ncbi:MAG: serine/threonine-protein kinase, partial [Deltaproteobacteria bacterium]
MTPADITSNLPFPTVPGYRIERRLGGGGFGVVLLATAPSGARVALKVASPDDAVAAAQLVREEKALRAIGPAAAPALHDTGTLPGGAPWLAMEVVEGKSLAQRLEEIGGPMNPGEVARLAPLLAEALAAVHAGGFVHLDLKPANIFIEGRVRLIDFGLSRQAGERVDRNQGFAGTPEYASPEQCEERADLDARADVYSFGAVLFHMCAGRPPFTGEAQAVREAQVGLRPPRPSQVAPVSAALEQVVLRCLAKDRGRRFQSAVELKAALSSALADDALAAAPAPEGPAPSRPLERKQVGLLLFSSGMDAGSVQSAVRSLGGELGHAARGRYAAIFPGEAGQDPVRRAFRAAQGLAERGLASRALVDLGTVNAQRRPDGSMRYISPDLGRESR